MLRVLNVEKTFNKGTVNEKKALNGLSLELEDGDFVTVIGGNGAGKSTMLNVIAGVYPIDRGQIILNGEDISTWPEYKRAKFEGRVFQDPMKGTAANMQIQENLAMAYRRGQKRGLKWAITKEEHARYHEALKNLNLGLEDRMTVKVGLLSGGQRHRLSIARAFLKDPPILILDEATSALDSQSEQVVQRSLEDLAKHRTTLVIAHRLSTIQGAQRILVLDENGICEEGTHQSLMAQGGVYAKLYEASFQV